jgi:hypothetical protein
VTVGSVDLADIQQTLSEMQDASQAGAPSSSVADDGAFATTLAQATSDLSGTGGLSGSGNGTLFSEELDGGGSLDTFGGATSSGGSAGELNLMAMLLSAQNGSGTVEASGSADLSGSEGATGQDVVDEASQLEGTP